MKEHSDQLKLLTPEFSQMIAELGDKPNYWKYLDKYRAKKEELKVHIQTEFKRWRKSLRALEMKILDQLHNGSFGQFEEIFQKAKEGN
jgi:DNA repair ATPase RecN